jgi:hypothetical protein
LLPVKTPNKSLFVDGAGRVSAVLECRKQVDTGDALTRQSVYWAKVPKSQLLIVL